jgi:ATP-binding cassette, subfamily B, bacterial
MTSDKPDADVEPTPGPELLRTAIRYIADVHGSIRRPFAVIVVTSAVAGVVEAGALILFVRAVIAITTDSAEPGITVDGSPGTMLAVAIVLALVAAVLHVVLARASVSLGERVAVNSRRRLINGFLDAQWAYVARYREGRFQEAVSVLVGHASRATAHLALGVSSILIIVALGIAATVASPLVTLTLLAVPVALFVIARPHLRRLRERSSDNVGGAMGLAEATAATVNLALEYRTTGTQRQRADRLFAIVDAHSAHVVRARSAGFTMTFLFKDSALIALIGIVGVLYLVTDLRSATLTAAVLLVIRMLGYLQQTFRLVQEGAEDLATIGGLRDATAELEAHREIDGSRPIVAVGTLRLDDVHYTYGGDRPALHGISLTIEPNTSVGVIGPSGAGKSTIAELLLGLRTPTSGTITVDGVPIEDVRRSDWTRLTAVVPQHQQLAHLSVADNIRFLRDWITDDDIVDAAKRAHVHTEIMALPGGYEHLLGSRNQGFSGGQRQRIAIARALAGHPQLLVLDEPTSALDPITEELFRQTLDELHKQVTIIVIAHRSATLATCDTVVHLRDGRIERNVDGPRRRSVRALPHTDDP